MSDERDGRRASAAEAFGLARTLTWFDGFSIALGVPALLLFSVGSIVVLTGTLSPLIWIVSVSIGLLQAFIFAEMASLFPRKSGGHSLYGAEAWRRVNRFPPPMTVWGNWFAWSPVLALGSLLIGSYVTTQWFPSQDWEVEFGPFSITFGTLVGAGVLLLIFWVNHFSIKYSARVQQVLGVISLVPIALLLIVPVFEGHVDLDRLTPIEPLGGDWWSWDTLTMIAAGLFVAAWSAYAFETTICYTAEYRNPGKDAPRAILAAGVLNLVFYGLGPIVLLGAVGSERIAEDPSVAFAPLAEETFGAGADVVIALLIIAFILIINTAILGSARTLYQASADGYTVHGLQKLSKRKVPVRAMGIRRRLQSVPDAAGQPGRDPRGLDSGAHGHERPRPARRTDPPQEHRGNRGALPGAERDHGLGHPIRRGELRASVLGRPEPGLGDRLGVDPGLSVPAVERLA